MSRVAKNPITIPADVQINIENGEVSIKGAQGQLKHRVHNFVQVTVTDKGLKVDVRRNNKAAVAISGTTRAILNNMVHGVSSGFKKQLKLIGVGYRAQSKGDFLDLTLGFSHPVKYKIPSGVSIETPSQTEIIVKGCDKQKVGQVAANIRSYRPPEPYKGKGVRYTDENVIKKEAKKK